MEGKFINKPLFGLQRKSNAKLFVVFSLIMAVMLFVVIALYPTIQQIADQMPDMLKEMLYMGSIEQYFNLEALEIWVMLVSIYVAIMAINLTTNEFKNGSYEMIYSLNMSRGEIIRTKLVRLILNTIYINIICLVSSLIAMSIFAGGQFSVVNLMIYALFAILVTMQIAIIVFSIGLFCKKQFSTVGGVVLVVIMFLFTTISSTAGDGKFDVIGYLSPMSTMKDSIMINGFSGIFTNGILLGVWSIISLLLLAVSFKKFKNDDLC